MVPFINDFSNCVINVSVAVTITDEDLGTSSSIMCVSPWGTVCEGTADVGVYDGLVIAFCGIRYFL